jgi:hypothetical protein
MIRNFTCVIIDPVNVWIIGCIGLSKFKSSMEFDSEIIGARSKLRCNNLEVFMCYYLSIQEFCNAVRRGEGGGGCTVK